MKRLTLGSALALSLASTPALAAPLAVTHSGYLLDSSDRPVSTPALSMSFRLYNVGIPGDSAEQLVWESQACEVAVANGFYSVVLGDGCTGASPLSSDHLPTDKARYLEVLIGGAPMRPRLFLGTMPTAAVATHALKADHATRSDDAEALATSLAQAGSINAAANPVDWTRLKGVPAALADGLDSDTTYAPAEGGGLALLAGNQFAIAAGGVTNEMLANSGLTVTAGQGLTGGGPVALGGSTALALAPSGVTAGSYDHATITVDAQGRVTSAQSNTVTSGTVTSITAGAGLAGGTITSSGTLSIAQGAITSAMLASEAASLAKVSGGAMKVEGGKIGIGVSGTVAAPLHVQGDVRIDQGALTVGRGPLRLGNTIYQAYVTSLPTTGSSGGYSPDPLHMKTAWTCGVSHLMYHLEFRGYHFMGNSEINADAVGYLYGQYGHTNNQTRTVSGTVNVGTYCASDNKLVFKLTASTNWHASDLVVNFIGGGSSYLRDGADTLQFTDVRHAPTNL